MKTSKCLMGVLLSAVLLFGSAFAANTLSQDVEDGLNEIVIESRTGKEVTHISGLSGKGKIETQNKLILTKTKGDHRICMSTAILSLVTGIKAKIKNFETVNTSFPEFLPLIKSLGAKVNVKK